MDGRTPGRFFAEEVAAPWGLDFHFGLAASEQARCARLVDEGGAWRQSLLDDPRPLLVPALDNPPGALDADVVNSAAYRAAEVPAVNGHGTARAVASFYGGLASGGVLDGVRLFEQATVDEALHPWASGEDLLLESSVNWGLGLQSDPDGFFGLGGIGGFSGYGVRRDGLAAGFGYVTCKLGGHDRADACARRDGGRARGLARAVGRRVVRVEDPPEHVGPVRVALLERDEHLVADLRHPEGAARAADGLDDADPGGAVLVVAALAVPVELHLHAPEAVGVDLRARRADDDGGLRAVHDGHRRRPRRPERQRRRDRGQPVLVGEARPRRSLQRAATRRARRT